MAKPIENLFSEISERDNERILMDYVAPVVEEILRKHIEKDVYGAYTPWRYNRRGSLTARIQSKILPDGTLLVTSMAEPNVPHTGWQSSGDGAFLYMLEVGDLGWWRKGFPRPAITNAQKETDHSGKVKAAIKQGRKSVQGI